jgi:carbon starvation protein
MCGAISGFHALVSSGTTPKMVDRESHIRPIGYGAMLVEGFVAVAALTAACALEPGDYFKINVPPAKYETLVKTADQKFNWDLKAKEFDELEHGTEEKLAGRTGGAVTLAVGMAKVFSNLPGMKTLISYWYHFIIMFEVLFILTLLETGTRVARFVFHEAATQFTPHAAIGQKPNWVVNIVLSALVSFAWGFLLYIGNLDTLWRILGISNQLLASIALAVGTTYILTHAKRKVYALCTGIPFVFVLATVLTAGVESILSWWGLAFSPDTPVGEVFLLKLACVLASVMWILTVVIALDAARKCWSLLTKSLSE